MPHAFDPNHYWQPRVLNKRDTRIMRESSHPHFATVGDWLLYEDPEYGDEEHIIIENRTERGVFYDSGFYDPEDIHGVIDDILRENVKLLRLDYTQ